KENQLSFFSKPAASFSETLPPSVGRRVYKCFTRNTAANSRVAQGHSTVKAAT
ncbi:MAG: hypothetical protein MHMPM18_004802, partial [Marteilia pararefringens]